tara:strand:+ start:104 stop:838 length:735 start_codon:yes stop_codon:yes gene_type:complete
MEEGIKKVIITDLVLFIAGKSFGYSWQPKSSFLDNLKEYTPYINELVEGRIVSYFLDEEELKLIDGTLLHIAVSFGNAWAVKMILEGLSNSVDTSIETEEGETALDIAEREYNELQKEGEELRGRGLLQMVWNRDRLYAISESMQQYQSILKSFRIYEQEYKSKRGYRDRIWALEVLGFGPNDNPSKKEINTAYRKKARKQTKYKTNNKTKQKKNKQREDKFQDIGAAVKILLPESNKVIKLKL